MSTNTKKSHEVLLVLPHVRSMDDSHVGITNVSKLKKYRGGVASTTMIFRLSFMKIHALIHNNTLIFLYKVGKDYQQPINPIVAVFHSSYPF
jgi:hypothetical protein